MIIITGAAGFIGSCMVGKLNDQGHMNLLVVDDFSREDKNRNLLNKKYIARVHRDDLFSWIDRMHHSIEFIFHLGARTDTTEKDTAIFDRLNLHYSQEVWKRCAQYGIPLVYASSAATYGLGELGYDDRHDIVDRLRPLNPYGVSKNDFDIWALEQEKTPPFWAGLKFFNVYGPNEYHKGRMASVIFHTVRQIKATGGMKLFRSHRPDYADGAQSRDFIFVRDVLDIQYFLYQNRAHSGLYNVGTGKARTFLDLATNTFLAMGLAPNISFIDTPEDIRDTYQYFTEANMDKLRGIGYDQPFHSLEDGIREYVQQYLLEEKIF
ncbi:MAG: ADP-glyceromanno-heptose 6-epimerase [Haliscomenobacter sp.]|nr:ADP-glyceromanno-heptose 6-epimerase [Haliscomenobacter sp.]